MVVMPEDAATSQDGLQFLCSKYSTLITRLREEVLAHQQCQAEGRLLERRLREESQIWAQEKEQLLRDQQCLKDEIASLKIQLQGGRQQASDAASASRRCAGRELLANPGGGPMWQHEAQQKQHQQMMTLLNEHSQLQVEQRNAEDELNACRDHLSRWRRKAADLETQALDAAQGRDDAEKKARCAQEEMRQALRSLAGAKNRQKEAERLAKQEASQARDLEERLKATERFLHFKRCCSSSATAMSRLGIFAASAASCLVHGIATMPSMPWADSSCQAAPGCNALELEGVCCPNEKGVTLDCCQLAKCSSHPKCSALGLLGDCCPNTDGTSLDCCTGGDASDVATTSSQGKGVSTSSTSSPVNIKILT
eukprot:symbB.v1.2.020736.t1/scaffold1762.1/size182224/3